VPRQVWAPPPGEAEEAGADAEAVAVLRRARAGVEGLRRRLREAADLVPAREIETAIAFLEWLRERRAGGRNLDDPTPLGEATGERRAADVDAPGGTAPGSRDTHEA